jgi:hypothetical protein
MAEPATGPYLLEAVALPAQRAADSIEGRRVPNGLPVGATVQEAITSAFAGDTGPIRIDVPKSCGARAAPTAFSARAALRAQPASTGSAGR